MIYVLLTLFILLTTLYLLRSWVNQYIIHFWLEKGGVEFKRKDYRKFIKLFFSLDWERSFMNYRNEVVLYSSGDMIVGTVKAKFMDCKLLYIDDTHVFIKNPFIFYKLLFFIEGSPPLNDIERKYAQRDNIINDILK